MVNLVLPAALVRENFNGATVCVDGGDETGGGLNDGNTGVAGVEMFRPALAKSPDGYSNLK